MQKISRPLGVRMLRRKARANADVRSMQLIREM